jgi:hypothetical protein
VKDRLTRRFPQGWLSAGRTASPSLAPSRTGLAKHSASLAARGPKRSSDPQIPCFLKKRVARERRHTHWTPRKWGRHQTHRTPENWIPRPKEIAEPSLKAAAMSYVLAPWLSRLVTLQYLTHAHRSAYDHIEQSASCWAIETVPKSCAAGRIYLLTI